MTRFEPHPEWLEELLYSEELTAIVTELGEEVLAQAISNAEATEETGAFAGSIKGGTFRWRRGASFYRVWSDDPASLSIEFGTVKSKAHRALGRAIGGTHD